MQDPVWYPLEDKNIVNFAYTTAPNAEASAKAGRPVHDRLLQVTVASPGSRQSNAVMDLERELVPMQEGAQPVVLTNNEKIDSLPGLRKALEAFKREQSPAAFGTPLADWPAMNVAMVADLRALNIHTVEQMAGASDATLQTIGMGARALQAKAQAFLDAAKGQAPALALAEDNALLKRQMAILESQIAELKASQKEPAHA